DSGATANPGDAITGQLTADDPRDRVRTDSYHKVHRMRMQPGRVYQIDLASTAFDAYLRLEDAQGNQLAYDDDSGEGHHNARIVFNPPRDEEYRVIVTSYDTRGTGAYTLTIRPRDGIVGELTANDAFDRVRAGRHAKVHTVRLTAGRTYRIDLES